MNNVRKIFKTIIMKTEVTATTYRKIRGMYLKHYLSDIKLIQKNMNVSLAEV